MDEILWRIIFSLNEAPASVSHIHIYEYHRTYFPCSTRLSPDDDESTKQKQQQIECGGMNNIFCNYISRTCTMGMPADYRDVRRERRIDIIIQKSIFVEANEEIVKLNAKILSFHPLTAATFSAHIISSNIHFFSLSFFFSFFHLYSSWLLGAPLLHLIFHSHHHHPLEESCSSSLCSAVV